MLSLPGPFCVPDALRTLRRGRTPMMDVWREGLHTKRMYVTAQNSYVSLTACASSVSQLDAMMEDNSVCRCTRQRRERQVIAYKDRSERPGHAGSSRALQPCACPAACPPTCRPSCGWCGSGCCVPLGGPAGVRMAQLLGNGAEQLGHRAMPTEHAQRCPAVAGASAHICGLRHHPWRPFSLAVLRAPAWSHERRGRHG